MEKEAENTSRELDTKMELYLEKMELYGLDVPLVFDPKNLFPDRDRGMVRWQNAGEVGKDYKGSGHYEAYVYVPNNKKYVRLGVAFVHYLPQILGEVLIPADQLLEMKAIELVINCDIDEYHKKAHLKMDETNTAKLKEYLRSDSSL